MSINEYFIHEKDQYNAFLRYIDSDDAKDFENFNNYFFSRTNPENNLELKSFLRLLLTIYIHHCRRKHFLDNIKKIFLYYKEKIEQNIPKIDLFDLCRENKQIILILLENKIITLEDLITDMNQSNDIEYKCFFYPEIKYIINKEDKEIIDKKLSEFNSDTIQNFNTYRQIGENHSHLCSLIREDLITEFVSYISRNDINLSKISIKQSIFETNPILKSNEKLTLIEYACFFGSIKIYQYLKKHFTDLSRSLMIFAIHSRNIKMIHLVEQDLESFLKDESFCLECLEESIKCHHNEIADYFFNIYTQKVETFSLFLKYHNFHSIFDNITDAKLFELLYDSCKYNYINFLQVFLDNKFEIDPEKAFQNGCQNKEVMIFLLNKKIIGIEKFRGCTTVTNLTIPSFITVIKESSFEGCKGLVQITIPSSVTTIENRAFSDCSSLKEITIPSSVTTIGERAFNGCSSLEQVILPSPVTKIDKNVFSRCSRLVQITIPSSVTVIENSAFSQCSSLKEITIPSSVTIIGKSAFSRCSSLEQVILPSSVTTIENSVFNECSSLKEITIPSSVTTIGKNAFNECSSLEQVILPSSVTQIKGHVFNNCSSLKEITISSSITEINSFMFDKCTSLERVTFNSSSLASIYSFAFNECTSLAEITIPSSVTFIGDNAFYGCSSLKRIIIPPLIESIEEFTFAECRSLESVTIPSSVKVIGQYAFLNCSSLSQIKIPSDVREINSGAFENCSSLTQIEIPTHIDAISDNLFFGCSSLKEVKIPHNAAIIGSEAFYGCTSLEELSIPHVEEIDEGAFFGCSSLKKLEIGTSLNVKNYAFWGCYLIDPESNPDLLDKCDKHSFDNCFKLSQKIEKECPKQAADKVLNIDDYDILECTSNNDQISIFKATNKHNGEDVIITYYKKEFHHNFFFAYAITNLGIPGVSRLLSYSLLTEDLLMKEEQKEIIDSVDEIHVRVNYSNYITVEKLMNYDDFRITTFGYLNSRRTIMNPTIRSKIIFGIAAIMCTLHDFGIVHQRLSMRSILLDEKFEPLITNFYHSGFDLSPDDSDALFYAETINDAAFCSPEIMLNREVDDKSDVYSYAMILYFMFTNDLRPDRELSRKNTFYDHITKGRRFLRPENIPDHYWELIISCWNPNPFYRPSFYEIVDLLKNDIYALEEFGMKTDLNQLHEYQEKFNFED